MASRNLLQLPVATSPEGALLYGVQNNTDKAFPPSVLLGNDAVQAANFVYAGPVSGQGALPSFRRLAVNDIPNLSGLYMSVSGGNLNSPNIFNPTITGANISGSTIIVDDDKFRIRNATDTTKIVRFSAAGLSAGQTRVFNMPDVNGEVVVGSAIQDMSNKSIYLRPSTNTAATLRVAHGQPPSAPVDGDIWTTAGGLYARISGATVGPMAGSGAGLVTSFNTRGGDITLLSSDVTGALGFTPYNSASDQYVRKSGDTMSGSLTATTLSDSGGNIRTGINDANTNANSRVAKAGDDMTGNLNVYAELRTGQSTTGGGLRVVTAGSGVTSTTYLDARRNLSVDAPNAIMQWRADSYVFEAGGSPKVSINTGGNLYATGRVYVTQGAAPSPYPTGLAAGLQCLTADGNARLFAYNYSTNQNVNMVYEALAHQFQGGAVTSQGGFGPVSDPRTKDSKTFRRLDNALDKVYNLNVTYGKYHDWFNPDGKERVFLMADESMRQNVPQAILKDVNEVDSVKYDGWSVDQMIALLVKAVQELTDEVAMLKEQNNELSN